MKDEKSIKELLGGLLKTYKLNDKFDEVTVVNSWEQIVGKGISQKTGKVSVHGKKLYVQVNSAALKNELFYHKQLIIDKVNDFIGKQLINEIIIT